MCKRKKKSYEVEMYFNSPALYNYQLIFVLFYRVVTDLMSWKPFVLQPCHYTDEKGNTPMHLAALGGHVDTLQELIGAKFSIDTRSATFVSLRLISWIADWYDLYNDNSQVFATLFYKKTIVIQYDDDEMNEMNDYGSED